MINIFLCYFSCNNIARKIASKNVAHSKLQYETFFKACHNNAEFLVTIFFHVNKFLYFFFVFICTFQTTLKFELFQKRLIKLKTKQKVESALNF